MFNTVLNRAHLEMSITAVSPVMIKSGRQTADPARPDMEFVRTRDAAGRSTVFIPGSSLKGVVRSHAERLLRSLTSAAEIDRSACNPFDRLTGCSSRLSRTPQIKPWERYRSMCPACRMFGSTMVASRVHFSDLLPNATEAPIVTEIRTGIGIDRLLGTAATGALFELEVAPAGTTFRGDVLIENFEAWQFVFLVRAIEDLNAGMVRVGFGASRGLGRVGVQVSSLVVEQRKSVPPVDVWRGIGELTDGDERQQYQLEAVDNLALQPMPARAASGWLLDRWTLDGHDAIWPVLQRVAQLEARPRLANREEGRGGRR